MHRAVAALFGAPVLALATVGTALGAAPEVVNRNDRFTVEFGDSATCPGLELQWRARIQRSLTVYYDRDGSITREVGHAQYIIWVTNAASGVTLRSPGTRHVEVDFVNNTFTDTGVYRNFTGKREGTVLHQSGRLIESMIGDPWPLLSMSGPHEDYLGEVADFCAALAG